MLDIQDENNYRHEKAVTIGERKGKSVENIRNSWSARVGNVLLRALTLAHPVLRGINSTNPKITNSTLCVELEVEVVPLNTSIFSNV